MRDTTLTYGKYIVIRVLFPNGCYGWMAIKEAKI